MKEMKMHETMGMFIDTLSETGAKLEFLLETFYRSYGVTKVQFAALFFIEEAEGGTITLSALGEKMGVSRANITTLADRMESKELIKRDQNAKDRRSIELTVTERGRGFISAIMPEKEQFISDIFNCLTEVEMKKGVALLEKLQQRIENASKNINMAGK